LLLRCSGAHPLLVRASSIIENNCNSSPVMLPVSAGGCGGGGCLVGTAVCRGPEVEPVRVGSLVGLAVSPPGVCVEPAVGVSVGLVVGCPGVCEAAGVGVPLGVFVGVRPGVLGVTDGGSVLDATGWFDAVM
jgi:hypothetical protein